jgi:hypothetical protein
LAKKGYIPWNKGKKFSEESKKKMSESKRGIPSPRKEKRLSEESIEKRIESHKNISEETKRKMSESKKDDSPLITLTDSEEDGYIELEDGIQINLSTGIYREGDYWIIPARTKSGKVEWPTGNYDEPLTVLKTRLAKGEITKEEFDKIKEDLKD